MAGYSSPGTTGNVKGNSLLVYIDAGDVTDPDVFVVGSGVTAIACTTNATISVSNDTIETVCKDNDGEATFEAGAQTNEITVDGLVAYDNQGRAALFAAARGKDDISLEYGTGVTGDPYTTYTAFISSYEETAPLNDIATYSVTFAVKSSDSGIYA